ncbi:MAG: hypothetical protein LBI53_01780 [Candidatus Peribacteria bacterium]|nr:hypothetical protein [Candidatus Peribacteria bacterium]
MSSIKEILFLGKNMGLDQLKNQIGTPDFEDQDQNNSETNIGTKAKINQENFSKITKKEDINKSDFQKTLTLLKQNEIEKKDFIEQTQEDFKTFPQDSKQYTLGQKAQLQTYGQLYFPNAKIIIDGDLGPQTRMIIESLKDFTDFSPENFSKKISNILKEKKTDSREIIKEKLLQQARETINDDNREQRETHILTLKK